MNRLLLRTIFVAFTIGPGITASAQNSDFDAALRAHNATRYDQAIELLEGILAKNQHSTEVYYNLGSAYFESGQLGSAILNYERALKIDPNNSRVKEALQLANEDVRIQITKIDDFLLWRWYRKTLSLFSSNTWAIVQIALGFFFLYAVYLWMFNSRFSRTRKIILLVSSLTLTLVAWWSARQKKQIEIGNEGAIVMMDEALLYKAADDRSEVVSDLSEGVKLLLIDRIGDWIKVQSADKDVGWIEIKKVEII